MSQSETISLARGAPSIDIVATEDLRAAADAAFSNDPTGTFSYGTAAGY
ncbi:MAG: PLP-dependent aminotransferase family protein, partial [Thermoleophilaceae bacterium]|nr:PLP-dependent aminotransferase family protein [Thermoleophilaceae bacterium]